MFDTTTKKFGLAIVLLALCDFVLFAVWPVQKEEHWFKSDPCQRAREPLPKALKLPNHLRRSVERYKSDWVGLCESNGTKSVAELHNNARHLASDIFDWCCGPQSWNKVTDRGVVDEWLKSLPGVEVTHADVEIAAPYLEDFYRIAHRGQAIDHQFFNGLRKIIGDGTTIGAADLAPWVALRWHDGGCTLYGQYDWIQTLTISSELRALPLPRVYKEKLDSLEHGLFEEFRWAKFEPSPDTAMSSSDASNEPSICTCGDKNLVVRDLETLKEFTDHSRYYRKYSEAIGRDLALVKSGKLKIRSDDKEECRSGG